MGIYDRELRQVMEERLKEFWGEKFDVVELRKGENIVEDQMWESEYLYICVFKRI